MKEYIQKTLRTWKELLQILVKWIVLSMLVSIVIGVIASAFSYAVGWATEFRKIHPLIIWGMPIGGIVIVFLYKIAGQEKNAGTNLVLTVVRSKDTEIPGRVSVLILLSTVITHLFGGSSGREGAALQFGASIGNLLGRKIRLSESDKKIMMLASMSAAFAALFGTPAAAAIFPIEVISVGVMYYAALVPCIFSSFMAYYVSLCFKVHTLSPAFPVESVPGFYGSPAWKILVLAVCCALVGAVFCVLLHNCEKYFKRWIPNPYLRVMAGAAGVIVLYLALRTDAYLGLGDETIHRSFETPAGPEMFLLKMVFTCLTLCVGFKGGEIVPSLFIGAVMGSALSVVLGLPADVCAACGMAGVFCAVTNSPISSVMIALEMFGAAGMPFYCVVVGVSYLLSGYQSLYKEQKIVYSKTENKYINRSTS